MGTNAANIRTCGKYKLSQTDKLLTMTIPRRSSSPAHQGFTMIELLVVIGIVAVLAMIAAPTLTSFAEKSAMRGLASDFTSSMQRARSEAVSRNMCVTMCRTLDPNAAAPRCSTAAGGDYLSSEWHSGWIVYLNPSCDRTITSADPAVAGDIIQVQQAGNIRYGLIALGNAPPRSFTFGPTGTTGLGAISSFSLKDAENNNSPLNRKLCVDQLGRVRTIEDAANCN